MQEWGRVYDFEIRGATSDLRRIYIGQGLKSITYVASFDRMSSLRESGDVIGNTLVETVIITSRGSNETVPLH